jgi:hypothetical protein
MIAVFGFTIPCNGTMFFSLLAHRGGTGFDPKLVHRELWEKKRHWDKFSFECFGLSPLVAGHQCSILIQSPVTNATEG